MYKMYPHNALISAFSDHFACRTASPCAYARFCNDQDRREVVSTRGSIRARVGRERFRQRDSRRETRSVWARRIFRVRKKTTSPSGQRIEKITLFSSTLKTARPSVRSRARRRFKELPVRVCTRARATLKGNYNKLRHTYTRARALKYRATSRRKWRWF